MFTFSFIIWLLKKVFLGTTNGEIGDLFDTLFLHLTSPYWYLYVLLFIFMITPTFRNRKMAGAGMKVLVITGDVCCFSIVMIITELYEGRKQSIIFGFLAKYTMLIFFNAYSVCSSA